LEEFAYVASHDLQEPLRMVRSFSQLLIRGMEAQATDEQREFVRFIETGTQRMEHLIRDLLAYSRTVHTVSEKPLDEVSLEEALDHALSMFDARLREACATSTRDPLPSVHGNMTQLSHVFQNLLSNALKYCSTDKPIQIHIGATKQDGDWVVSVRDNGIGFRPEYAERIFGLFKRLHREDEYPGTGLGLAICRRIVERYGGRMWAQGEPGVGSTFFFSLPTLAQ